MDKRVTKKGLTAILTVGVLLGMSGCQSTPAEPAQVLESNQEHKEKSAFTVYEQSKAQYEQWLATLKESADLKIYSEDRYADLLNAWEDTVEIYQVIATEPAKVSESYSLFSSATYAQVFAERLSIVVKNHAAILKIKEQADRILSDSQAQMAYLQQIDAAQVYANDYRRLDNDYHDLFEYVADGELDDVQIAQVAFLNKAKALEVKVTLAKYILPLQKKLQKFKRADFHRQAAICYAKAQTEISAAENVVKTNARDLKLIEESVTTAEFELAHVSNIASEVKLLSHVRNNKFEPLVLQFEEKLLAVSQALNGSDYRDQPLTQQSKLIVGAVNKLRNDKEADALKSANSDQKTLLAELQKQNNALTKQLQRSDFQITSLESLVSSYKKQLESKLVASTPSTEPLATEVKAAPAVNTAPAVNAVPEVNAAPAVSAAPVVNAAPAVDAAPAVNTAPVVNAAPAVKTAPVVNAAPAVNTAPVVNAAPAVNTAPVVNAAPAVNTAPAVDAAPVVNAVPAVNTASVVNAAPAVNTAPAVNAVPAV